MIFFRKFSRYFFFSCFIVATPSFAIRETGRPRIAESECRKYFPAVVSAADKKLTPATLLKIYGFPTELNPEGPKPQLTEIRAALRSPIYPLPVRGFLARYLAEQGSVDALSAKTFIEELGNTKETWHIDYVNPDLPPPKWLANIARSIVESDDLRREYSSVRERLDQRTEAKNHDEISFERLHVSDVLADEIRYFSAEEELGENKIPAQVAAIASDSTLVWGLFQRWTERLAYHPLALANLIKASENLPTRKTDRAILKNLDQMNLEPEQFTLIRKYLDHRVKENLGLFASPIFTEFPELKKHLLEQPSHLLGELNDRPNTSLVLNFINSPVDVFRRAAAKQIVRLPEKVRFPVAVAAFLGSVLKGDSVDVFKGVESPEVDDFLRAHLAFAEDLSREESAKKKVGFHTRIVDQAKKLLAGRNSIPQLDIKPKPGLFVEYPLLDEAFVPVRAKLAEFAAGPTTSRARAFLVAGKPILKMFGAMALSYLHEKDRLALAEETYAAQPLAGKIWVIRAVNGAPGKTSLRLLRQWRAAEKDPTALQYLDEAIAWQL